jgi:hypothetical protein
MQAVGSWMHQRGIEHMFYMFGSDLRKTLIPRFNA